MSLGVVEAYRDWVLSKPIVNGVNITFTLKQWCSGIALDEISTQRNFRYFKNILNGKVFGNAYRRYGKELKMLVVLEESIGSRIHLHTIIEKPNHLNVYEFDQLVKVCWGKTFFGYDEIHITHPSSNGEEEGWKKYIMKRKTKKDFSQSIDLDNSSCLYLC